MGQLIGSLSFIGYIGMTVFFYGAMIGILWMLRRVIKDLAALKKAVEGLEHQITMMTPPPQARRAAEGE